MSGLSVQESTGVLGGRSAASLLADLASSGFTGHGVPGEYGGGSARSGSSAELIKEAMREDMARGLVLVSQLATIHLLLASRNVALREHYVPQLVAGELFGSWPSAAMEMLLLKDESSVRALDTGRGMRLSGTVGRVLLPGSTRFLIASPITWNSAKGPGIALLDGDQDGLNLHQRPTGAYGNALASVDLSSVYSRDDEWLDVDGLGLVSNVLSGELEEGLCALSRALRV